MNENSPQNTTRVSIETLVGTIQNLLASVLAIAGILTAGGFIVVNTYLAQYTNIQVYTINTKQYLAAGVGLLFPVGLAALVIYIFDTFGRSYGTRLNRITGRVENGKGLTAIEQSVARKMLPKSSKLQLRLLRMRFWILLVGLIYYTVFFGLLYGQYIYGTVPRFLGGGKPEPVILVFNDPELPALFNLTEDPQVPRRSATVLIMAELEDGLLVLDARTGQVAALKQQFLTGVMSALPVNPASSSATNPVPSPTATP
ncbi:MAG: hypothetical protein R3E39_09630 [Anaerolineae bacterium]